MTEAVVDPKQIAGRYRVLDVLGRGGMGAVYRALDDRCGQEVALKRLLVDQPERRALLAELFEREYYTLSELSHPRIIEVYDYGVDDEGAYYTMELLGGDDLRELGTLPWQRACAILRDVASSLSILHSRRLIHGDISPRNVRCTSDGRAKLLDFGAMMPMGPVRRAVGTAPFTAPEMVQLQSLDGRTDLFGLGALGYYVLTGRHAYPARTFRDLPAMWRSPLRSPRELAADVPEALSELIMECLQLNRAARPRSAAVVMERLCALSGLPLEEQADVAAAYLTTPSLVGRERPLTAVRSRLVDLLKGNGSVCVVEGAPGSGRSRFLDACVLEAKLLGHHVLRVDAGEGGASEHGVMRSLCAQLFEIAPDAARNAARLNRRSLSHLLSSELVEVEPSGPPPSAQRLLAAVRDFILAAARGLRLVIAVDDVDRVDEASASILVALALKVQRRPLCLLVARERGSAAGPSFEVLGDACKTLELLPLDETQTEQLISSLFGGAPHYVTVARGVHSVAAGNPRAIMQLTTHLLERGVVRYEAGSFLLPERLTAEDLPASLTEALRERLFDLSADARELARVLCLTDPLELPAARYPELTSHRDRARTFRALDELVRIELLLPLGERYRLADATWRAATEAELDADQKRDAHALLSRVFEPDGTVARRAYHLMESAQTEAAIRVLLAQYLKDPLEPRDPLEDYVPGLLDVLERAAMAAEDMALPAALKLELRMKTIGASQFIGDYTRFQRIAPATLAQLKHESGIQEYATLDPAMEPGARLTEALTRVQARYDASPEAERGVAPVDAVRELSRLCAMYAGMTGVVQDVSLLDEVPSLLPLVPLSPAIAAIQQMIDGMRYLIEGRSGKSSEQLLSLVARLEEPDGAGLGALYQKSIRLGALYIVGVLEASMGLPSALRRVAPLEREPGHRVNAQRVHAACHLMQGEVEEAAAAQRRAELVMLQDGQQQRYPGTTARPELLVYGLLDDLAGVKQLTERIALSVETFPAWEPIIQLGRYYYLRIQGDHQAALEVIETALSRLQPGRHLDWSTLAAAHVKALSAAGRAEEAVSRGRACMEICLREELHPGYESIARASAEALIAAERYEDAVEVLDELTAQANAAGVRGLLLGELHELRARAAIGLQDRSGFERHASLCAAEFRPESNPALSRKHRRLLREAQQAGLSAPSCEPLPSQPPQQESTVTAATAHSRLLECPDSRARSECVLRILAEHVGPDEAYLFAVREGQVRQLCALPEGAQTEGLHEAVMRHLERELELDGGATMALDVESTEKTHSEHLMCLDTGTPIYAVSLISTQEGQPVLAAIVAFRMARAFTPPPAHMHALLAAALLENDDVDPLTCMA